MDADRIMVLDAGRIVSRLVDLRGTNSSLSKKVEFDSPAELLRDEKGRLRALVNESKDKDALLAMVAGRTADS
ncbi:hypothetical protein HWV62_37247 [Athelia sp. TMB]|nr:hypothetical protein HWV62_37247 [Athelia sp. TMB]